MTVPLMSDEMSFFFKEALRASLPDFSDLPWDRPLEEWGGICPRVAEVPRGLSRHQVEFVNYAGRLYALKQLPPAGASGEYQALQRLQSARMPSVEAVGHVQITNPIAPRSILITRYLEHSIPFRSLFMGSGLQKYRANLLDALAGLLVQLHLAGVFWGDCSLSNSLFRRDAGMLQAYLVDAETVEFYPDRFPPELRHHEMEIMEMNINGEINDLAAANRLSPQIPTHDTGATIRLRYQRLWEECTREDIINPGERYRIQERINALNHLGFSVGNVELLPTQSGTQLRLRVIVSDRNFHRDQILALTGLTVEEKQAQKMMNEIQELKATLSEAHKRITPVSVAAYHWLQHIYQPTIEQLQPYERKDMDASEMYCQLLEHKWYLSERAKRDVGHQAAIEDYIKNIIEKTA